MFWPILQFSTSAEVWQQNTAVVWRLVLLVLEWYSTSSSKAQHLHFKSESKLHSTKHCNWLFPSGPSYTYLQIEKFEQKMMKSFDMRGCWFFPLKMKFRLILVHPYVKCSIFSGVYFLKEHFYGIREYHIVSNPILFNSQPACYTPVNLELGKKTKTKLAYSYILQPCSEKGKAWYLLGILTCFCWKASSKVVAWSGRSGKERWGPV